MVGAAGFEPATLWSQTRCATRLRYAPIGKIYNAYKRYNQKIKAIFSSMVYDF